MYPLHQAVLRGDVTGLARVLEEGADLNQLDEDGNTALHWAVFRGDREVVVLLLEHGANPNAFSADGVTPCWRAVDFGLKEIEFLLREHGGRVATNGRFDRRSFELLSEVFGSPIPPEDSK